jgi:hypothetical protein
MNIKAFAPVVTVTDAMKQDFEVHTLREFAATLNGVACNVRLTFCEFAPGTRYTVAGVDDRGEFFVKAHSNLSDAEADYHHQSFPLMIVASAMLGEMARQMEELSNAIDTRADVNNAAHAAEQGE